ncbi:hypothetical protein, partial [Escherichia coli]|uniref:hypothetical protein n=1 Tax=Escherichia coli TaxID=562 RepID=UPI002FEFD8BB
FVRLSAFLQLRRLKNYQNVKIPFWSSGWPTQRIFEQNSKGSTDNLREVIPLAAAPATERSERVGEEAEEN